jgi:hypothetical protein
MTNRYDKALMIFIVISAFVLYASLEWFVRASTSDQVVAVVRFRDREVLRVDLSVDGDYVVDGTLGPVYIEVRDRRIRVERETSPNNICSIQGWVEFANIPIVCLPNDIVILIENAAPNPNDEDVIIQ